MKKNQKKLQLNNNDDAPATKGDLKLVKGDLMLVKGDLMLVKGDLNIVKRDLKIVREELHDEMEAMKQDLQKEMKAMDKNIREDMKVELARLLALTRLDGEEQTKEIIETIREDLKQLKSQFFDHVDGFVKEVRDAEVERKVVANQLSENGDKLENHEFRINTLEKKMKLPLLHASE